PGEALAAYDKALAIKPDLAEAWVGNGKSLCVLRQYDKAIAAFDKALALQPDLPVAWLGRGNGFAGVKRYDEAFAAIDQALALNPGLTEAWLAHGSVNSQLGRHDEALAGYDKALGLDSEFAEAWLGRGYIFTELKRYDDAFAAFDKALALKPDLAEAWLGRGNINYHLGQISDALAAYDRALALRPDLARALTNRGNVLVELKRYDEAFAAFDKALMLQPDLAEAALGRGNVFFELKSYADALTAYDKAIALKRDLPAAWLGRGNVLSAAKRYDESAAAYAMLLEGNSPFPFAKGMLLHQKMLSCDWTNVDSLIFEIDSDIASGKLSAEPFGWQGVARSPRSLQQCAELYNKQRFPEKGRALHRAASNSEKIRIGYLSGELCDHATAHLMVGVLERHDRSRFEIYGIDNGPDDGSEMRKRINAALNGIIDISEISDDLAVEAIQKNQIDILVNLNGYFGEFRMGVFAQRCAPVQVNYLGFPGTLGADYIDYIVADRHVL